MAGNSLAYPRRTAGVVQACWKIIKKNPKPDILHSICMLTWITKNNRTREIIDNTLSVGRPAFSDILGMDLMARDAESLGRELVQHGLPKAIGKDVASWIGIVHFYRAYRDSSRVWMRKNYKEVHRAMKLVASAKSDDDRREAYRIVGDLPNIPLPKSKKASLSAANLLTPTLACLDSEERCPIINGQKHIQNILKQLNFAEASLVEQFDVLITLMDVQKLDGAFKLDQLERLPSSIALRNQKKKNRRSERSKVGRTPTDSKALPDKDEKDAKVILAVTTTKKKLHNKMTNALAALCRDADISIVEGRRINCRYDAMIVDYTRKGTNVLIEAKTSDEMAVCRMAVGQLLDYRRTLEKQGKIKSIVLLPQKPSKEAKAFFEYAGVGVAWFGRNFSRIEGAIKI
jgi:hypothetical protein